MAEEYCWAITQAAGGHAAADHVPVFSSLGFKLESTLYTYKLATRTLNSESRKIRLALNLSKRNYSVSRGVPVQWTSVEFGTTNTH
jgi:hypothetical protein